MFENIMLAIGTCTVMFVPQTLLFLILNRLYYNMKFTGGRKKAVAYLVYVVAIVMGDLATLIVINHFFLRGVKLAFLYLILPAAMAIAAPFVSFRLLKE